MLVKQWAIIGKMPTFTVILKHHLPVPTENTAFNFDFLFLPKHILTKMDPTMFKLFIAEQLRSD